MGVFLNDFVGGLPDRSKEMHCGPWLLRFHGSKAISRWDRIGSSETTAPARARLLEPCRIRPNASSAAMPDGGIDRYASCPGSRPPGPPIGALGLDLFFLGAFQNLTVRAPSCVQTLPNILPSKCPSNNNKTCSNILH